MVPLDVTLRLGTLQTVARDRALYRDMKESNPLSVHPRGGCVSELFQAAISDGPGREECRLVRSPKYVNPRKVGVLGLLSYLASIKMNEFMAEREGFSLTLRFRHPQKN